MLGWTMLAEVCSETGCPLMENPETGQIYNAGLNIYLDPSNKNKQQPQKNNNKINLESNTNPITLLNPPPNKKTDNTTTTTIQIIREKINKWSMVLSQLSETDLEDLEKSLLLIRLIRESNLMLNEQ
jgi:uncharacterized Zn finger protein (UPF0148 family)